MYYSAALDLSGDEAALAIAEKNSSNIIIEQFRPMTGRNSAILVPWVIDLLNNVKLTLADIDEWTVGSGPGSFTGMRLVAAMIEGIVLGHNKKSRCVPTAMALAYAAFQDEKETEEPRKESSKPKQRQEELDAIINRTLAASDK